MQRCPLFVGLIAGILTVIVAPVAAQSLTTGQGDTENIVSSTQPSLGLQHFLQGPLINDHGQFLFHVEWEAGTGTQRRLYRGDRLGLQTEVARVTETVPDPLNLESLGDIRFNNEGRVAFIADLTTGESEIFRTQPIGVNSTQLVSFARTNDGVSPVQYTQFTGLGLSDAGHVVFRGRALLPTLQLDDVVGIGSGGVADEYFGGINGSLGTAAINRFGDVVYNRTTTDPPPNDQINVQFVGQSMQTLIDENTTEPQTDHVPETIIDPVINDSGQIAFRSTLVTVDEDDNLVPGRAAVLLSDRQGNLEIILTGENIPLPDGSGLNRDSVTAFSAPLLNDTGDVAFSVDMVDTSLGELNDSMLLLNHAGTSPNGGFNYLAAENDPTPDGQRRLGDLKNVPAALIDSGAVAFHSALRDNAGNDAGQGIFLHDPLEKITVAQTGVVENGEEIIDLRMVSGQDEGGRRGVNEHGQVAYIASLQDVGTGEFRQVARLFTPDLRWRMETDGRWADENVWTLGLQPASVHDVTIATQGGAAVEGPRVNTALKSLTVNGAFFSQDRLHLIHPATLTVEEALTIGSRGEIQHNQGGLSAGQLNNDGQYIQAAGAGLIAGAIMNEDRMQLDGITLVGLQYQPDAETGDPAEQFVNDGELSIGDDAEVRLSAIELGSVGLTNRQTLNLLGGRIVGSLLNDFAGQAELEGEIEGDFGNFGDTQLTGPLTVTGVVTNIGRIEIESLEALRGPANTTEFPSSSNYGPTFPDKWNNHGELIFAGGQIEPPLGLTNHPGGLIAGHGAVGPSTYVSETHNEGGVIHADVADERLIFNSLASNTDGAQILIEPGATVQSLFEPLSSEIEGLLNTGEIALRGPQAQYIGQRLVNYGTVHGQGRVAADVTNHGVIRATNGRLTITGQFGFNGPEDLGSDGQLGAGRIVVEQDASVFVVQGLVNNGGHIALAGGEFDNNAKNLTNYEQGVIGGWGTLRAADVRNDGLMEFADNDTDVFADVINAGRIEVDDNTTTIFGNVTNQTTGSITVNNGELRIFGNLVNDGAVITDPTIVEVDHFINGQTGYVVADPGDKFVIHGDLLSESTQDLMWQTGSAILSFVGGTTHTLSLTGDDLGPTFAGLTDNFAWGTLELADGESLILSDANVQTPGDAALYLSRLNLAGGLEQIALIDSGGLNIYYDPSVVGNSYLGGQTYALDGGGQLAPIPEPHALLLLAPTALALLRRRADKPASLM